MRFETGVVTAAFMNQQRFLVGIVQVQIQGKTIIRAPNYTGRSSRLGWAEIILAQVDSGGKSE